MNALKHAPMMGGGMPRDSRGFVMLDALIAVLIFSVGIVGMIGMQAAATSAAGQAKYRTDAAMIADKYIAQMWTSNITTLGNSAQFQTGGTKYNAWLATLDCSVATALTNTCLPGVTANPPTVVIDNLASVAPQVTITVNWVAPSDGPHRYVSVTQFDL